MIACRCGKPAEYEVSMSAGEPFRPDRTEPVNLVVLSGRACRDCAFAAAQLLLQFLDSNNRPS